MIGRRLDVDGRKPCAFCARTASGADHHVDRAQHRFRYHPRPRSGANDYVAKPLGSRCCWRASARNCASMRRARTRSSPSARTRSGQLEILLNERATRSAPRRRRLICGTLSRRPTAGLAQTLLQEPGDTIPASPPTHSSTSTGYGRGGERCREPCHPGHEAAVTSWCHSAAPWPSTTTSPFSNACRRLVR